jgi:N-methylhydantoinase A
VRVAAGASGADTIAQVDSAFRDKYFEIFGIRPSDPCQLLDFRVRALGSPDMPAVQEHASRASAAAEALKGSRRAYFEEAGDYVDTPVYDRLRLEAGDTFAGPAIVEELDATTVCPPGYTVAVDTRLNMWISPAHS